MAQLHHLSLSVSLLLLSGLAAAAAAAADSLGGKKVMISVQYVVAELPGKKIRISMWEDGSGDDSRCTMDVEDNEPLGVAVQILFSTVANMRNHAAASRFENYTSDL